MKKIIILLSIVWFASCEKPEKISSTPPNIIFLIGDGMGLSQVSSVFYFSEAQPNFSRFKTIGLSKTSSGSHKVTDSGAGANAFSTGQKTYNGSIAVSMDTLPLKTITEELSEFGWSVGMVATSSITHATPAAFYSHVKSRRMEEDIATFLLNSKVDFFAGGGKKFFFNRKDSVNYFPILQERGFIVDTNSIDNPIGNTDKRCGYLLAQNGMPSMPDGRGDFLYKATDKAISFLEKKNKPFFLMIEGSQIDWAGHDNKSDYLIQEMLDFDKVIGYVLDYAQKQGNTLVVVTADHETGGFTLAAEEKLNEKGKMDEDENTISPRFSTGGHSAALVPVFAYGPYSNLFGGVYENTSIHNFFKEATGLNSPKK